MFGFVERDFCEVGEEGWGEGWVEWAETGDDVPSVGVRTYVRIRWNVIFRKDSKLRTDSREVDTAQDRYFRCVLSRNSRD